MLGSNNKVQSAGALLAGRCFWTRSWCWRSGSLARRAFVFFVVDAERANNEKLTGRICNFVQDFSRGTGRSLECHLDQVALDQFRCRRPARFHDRRTSYAGSWCGCWRCSSFLRQRITAKRGDAVHFRVEQNVDEHLNLRQFLSKQRRYRRAWHHSGELVKAEL